MEGVLVSVSTGVMTSLLTKLATLLEKDHKLIKRAKTDITSLRDEMSSMNAMLVNMSSMEKLDAQQKEWRDKVRELAYDMEDCVDTFMHDLDHGATKAGFMHRIKALKQKYEIANLIEALKSRAVEQSKRRRRYELGESIDRPRHVAIDPRIPARFAEAASLVGIDGPKEELIKLLRREDGTQQLKVVSIVGFGGIGKTTLAKHVYTQIEAQFDHKAFVSVSQNHNLVKVLTTILSGGNTYYYFDESTRDDERLLIDISRRVLKDKRYLIVIDDIWTMEAWNIIKCAFVENNRGSRIIATTRIESVAMACCFGFHDRGHVYKIKPLNDHDSRRLFHRMVFHSEDGCPEQLNNVSDEILKKCGGVPLAILSVASILASHEDVKSKEIWEKMRSNLSFQLETNTALEWMRHVFNLSYNDLPLHIKTCMLYFGVFPEDSEILKDDLLRRWIAEGFVCEKYTCGQQEVAESYFNELIKRNMIQIAEFNDCGEVMSCRVHDLMLDFIISKSTEDNFMTIISDQHRMKGPLKVRRLSVQAKNLENDEVLSNMALTQARSFSYSGPVQWIPSLPKFQLLRVLHLDVHASEAEYDLSYICNLFQLRYLRIRGVSYETLLSQLRKLQHLETLDIASDVGYLGLDVCELPITLRHLIVQGNLELFGEIGRMRTLRTLDELETHVTNHRSAENMKGLGELTNLRELKLYRCSGGGEETDSDVFLLSSLCKLGICNLRSLSIRGSFFDNDVLTCWSPPPCHLRRLHVLPCRFSMVPDWIAQLDKLSSLEVEVLSLPRDGVQVLARLPSLLHLRLHVENVPEEGVIIFGAAFRNLKEFWFRCKVMCLTFEAGAMPRLHSLEIECYAQGVRQANDVLLGIEHLESLKLFRVRIYENSGFAHGSWCSEVSNLPNNLEAALRKAISKHPGSPKISIRGVLILELHLGKIMEGSRGDWSKCGVQKGYIYIYSNS